MFDTDTLPETATLEAVALEAPQLPRRVAFNPAELFVRPLQRLWQFIFNARFSEAHNANDTPEMRDLVKEVMQTRWHDKYGPSPDDPAQYVNFVLVYGTPEQCLRAYQLGGKAVDRPFDQPYAEASRINTYLLEKVRITSFKELSNSMPAELEKIFIATLFGIRFDDQVFENRDSLFIDRVRVALFLYDIEKKEPNFEHAASMVHLREALNTCFFKPAYTRSSLSSPPNP